jgi:hypothetical protein
VLNLRLQNGVNAALGLCWTVAQSDTHAAARFKEGNQFAEGASAIGWENMHPNRAQQDQIERQTKMQDLIETW